MCLIKHFYSEGPPTRRSAWTLLGLHWFVSAGSAMVLIANQEGSLVLTVLALIGSFIGFIFFIALMAALARRMVLLSQSKWPLLLVFAPFVNVLIFPALFLCCAANKVPASLPLSRPQQALLDSMKEA